MKRRKFLASSAMAGLATPGMFAAACASTVPPKRKGNVRHSVCKWCYPNLTVEELAAGAAKLGMSSVELLDPEDWDTVKQYGLTCAMPNGPGGIEEGWNDPENHSWLVPQFIKRIEEVADAGLDKVICFSGNRNGKSDEEGLANCVNGLKQVLSVAEQNNVTVCMELLNSKVDHIDYQCDNSAWGIQLVDALGSDHFSLLYDIYHMQIMEGDVIRTITDNSDYFAHFHTGGNPGRNEIDETQELNYGAIAEAIVSNGFEGFVAQEFIPTRDPLTSLAEAVTLCDV